MVITFHKGLLPRSDIDIDLIKYKPNMMEDVLLRLFMQARWEDNEQWKLAK